MLTFVCVLKSGGDFDEIYVEKLRWQIFQNFTFPHQFTCLTDMMKEVGACAKPLIHDLPGWWSKFEIFNIPGPVLYLDLDNIIVKNIDFLEMLNTRDFPRIMSLRGYKSGLPSTSVLAWVGDYSWILEAFLEDTEGWEYVEGKVGLARKKEGRYYNGDQNAFQEILINGNETFEFIDVLGLNVSSYKHHCRKQVPYGTHIVGFHGRPRPPEAQAEWVKEYWGEETHA